QAILACRFEAIEQLDRGGLRVGLAPGAGSQLDQGVRLFRSCREDSTGAVIFEAAADQAVAIRKQGGSERVAGKAGERHAVEQSLERQRAIDQSSGVEPAGCHRAVSGRKAAFAGCTALIAW